MRAWLFSMADCKLHPLIHTWLESLLALLVVDSQLRAPKNAPSNVAPHPMLGLSKMCKNLLSVIRGKDLFGAAMASADFCNVLNGGYLRKQKQFFYLLLLWALTLSEKRACSYQTLYHCCCSFYFGRERGKIVHTISNYNRLISGRKEENHSGVPPKI